MHASPPAWRDHRVLPRVALFRGAVVGLVIAALVVAWPVSLPANADDPRIEKAQEQRRGAQERLDGVLQRLGELQAGVTAAEGELEKLTATVDAHRQEAEHATAAVALLAQASYRYGSADPTLALLSSGSPGEALAQARLLGLVAKQSRAGFEAASAARVRTQVTADAASKAAAVLRVRRDELDRTREEAAALVAAAERDEQQARTVVEAERAAAEARRTEAERAAAARTTTASRPATQPRPARGAAPSAPSSAPSASAGPGPPAPSSGGIACPVGQPRSYSDTYGAARSGGRSHKGTDILAPRGTPIYAYESGTISRMNSNRLGGISLYLNGASGTRYYYTHLQGYVAGLSAGQQVSSGQQIAYNGDTGNARGIPHLHFEVMPGGGGNVNPYPYVRRACG